MTPGDIDDALTRHPPGERRHIVSPANNTIKAIRALDLKKNRAATHLFVVEGARAALEALSQATAPLAIAYLDEAAHEPHVMKLATATQASGGLILEVNREVLGKLSRRDNSQTVVSVYRQTWHSLLDFGSGDTDRLLALETVRDPGNLGTILRTADGFDVRDILLIGEATDPYAGEAVRASMGSIFAVNLYRASLDDFLEWRREFPGLVVGTHLSGSQDIRTLAWRAPSLIVMGNEQKGLSAEMSAACDRLVRIPMSGRADSFNLAVATAITLYESRR
ncbi:MAG: RNA methyltransferase [Hyphomicrobiales bacterium]|nr:RNA methyltransferase [Hyphomicrobiales bacterium]